MLRGRFGRRRSLRQRPVEQRSCCAGAAARNTRRQPRGRARRHSWPVRACRMRRNGAYAKLTPGALSRRLVAHMRSTPGFTLQHLQFLVVDEADRLLRQAYQARCLGDCTFDAMVILSCCPSAGLAALGSGSNSASLGGCERVGHAGGAASAHATAAGNQRATPLPRWFTRRPSCHAAPREAGRVGNADTRPFQNRPSRAVFAPFAYRRRQGSKARSR